MKRLAQHRNTPFEEFKVSLAACPQQERGENTCVGANPCCEQHCSNMPCPAWPLSAFENELTQKTLTPQWSEQGYPFALCYNGVFWKKKWGFYVKGVSKWHLTHFYEKKNYDLLSRDTASTECTPQVRASRYPREVPGRRGRVLVFAALCSVLSTRSPTMSKSSQTESYTTAT